MPVEQSTIPDGLCQCGCGERTTIARWTNRQTGAVRGQPLRFIYRHSPWNAVRLYEIDSATGCWRWLRAPMADGYGRVYHNGKTVKAHRYVYEQIRGPIADGLDLDHVCHNTDPACPGGRTCIHRRCVNPDHLEPVPTRVNILRGKTPAAINRAKTHCSNGHPFDESNTYLVVTKTGIRQRRCKICIRYYVRLNKARRRARVAKPLPPKYNERLQDDPSEPQRLA